MALSLAGTPGLYLLAGVNRKFSLSWFLRVSVGVFPARGHVGGCATGFVVAFGATRDGFCSIEISRLTSAIELAFGAASL